MCKLNVVERYTLKPVPTYSLWPLIQIQIQREIQIQIQIQIQIILLLSVIEITHVLSLAQIAF